MYIPDVLNTLLMGLIFMVIVVTVVRPIMLNMLTGNANPQDMQRALIESVQAHVQRATQEVASQRTGKIRYQQLLLELPERRQPLVLPAPPVAAEEGAELAASSDVPDVDATTAASGDLADGASASNAGDVSMASDSEVNADAPSSDLAPGEIEIAEGESLHDIKERIKREKKNAAKPTIPPELLNGAKSYEDKVGVVRMVVHQDQSRVAAVIRGMIEVK
ncbi:hypothetical protein [Limnohabitans sp. TS-CS-82]|jgi:hypothetical protein|uniref:hypothetical protein n=1 Tax=Limnohabitans sp. TS-CS-82 TaxID=2094193 RepID=UPI0011B03AD3|nr:hypothetical protein [Limnohabitans sp. TS-CS-82]